MIILAIFVLVLFRSFRPFLRKILLKKINSDEFFIIESLLYLIPVLFFIIYLLIKKDLSFFSKLDGSDYGILFFIIGSGVVTYLIYMNLINKNRASYIVPIIASLSIAVLALIGYIFYNERLTTSEIIGIIIIIIGVCVMSIQQKTTSKSKTTSKNSFNIKHKEA